VTDVNAKGKEKEEREVGSEQQQRRGVGNDTTSGFSCRAHPSLRHPIRIVDYPHLSSHYTVLRSTSHYDTTTTQLGDGPSFPQGNDH
jgi:hypothetical protein